MNRRGYFYFDALIGLFLLGVVAAVLAMAETGYQRMARGLSDQRTAVRHAEQAIAALNAGQPPAADLQAVITPLPDAAPLRWRWVLVRTTEKDRQATLTALTRRSE